MKGSKSSKKACSPTKSLPTSTSPNTTSSMPNSNLKSSSFTNQFPFKLTKSSQQQLFPPINEPMQIDGIKSEPLVLNSLKSEKDELSPNHSKQSDDSFSSSPPPQPQRKLYAKRLWKMNRFKSEEAERQSKLLQSSHESLISTKSNNKHGFRRSHVKPKVDKDGQPTEFLFVDCTPTAPDPNTVKLAKLNRVSSPALARSQSPYQQEHQQEQQLQQDTTTSKVSRLFKGREKKNHSPLARTGFIEPTLTSETKEPTSPSSKLKFPFTGNNSNSNNVNSNNNVQVNGDENNHQQTGTRSTLKKLYRSRSKGKMKNPATSPTKINSSPSISSDQSSPSESFPSRTPVGPSPLSYSHPLGPITPIASEDSSFMSFGSNGIKPELPFVNNNSNNNSNNHHSSYRERSNSSTSILYMDGKIHMAKQHAANSSIGHSPIVNTPLQNQFEDDGSMEDLHQRSMSANNNTFTIRRDTQNSSGSDNMDDENHLVEVCSINTSSTKKIKTLRRSSSIASMASVTSVTQYPPATIGAPYSPVSPIVNQSPQYVRTPARARALTASLPSNAVPGAKAPLMKTWSFQGTLNGTQQGAKSSFPRHKQKSLSFLDTLPHQPNDQQVAVERTRLQLLQTQNVDQTRPQVVILQPQNQISLQQQLQIQFQQQQQMMMFQQQQKQPTPNQHQVLTQEQLQQQYMQQQQQQQEQQQQEQQQQEQQQQQQQQQQALQVQQLSQSTSQEKLFHKSIIDDYFNSSNSYNNTISPYELSQQYQGLVQSIDSPLYSFADSPASGSPIQQRPVPNNLPSSGSIQPVSGTGGSVIYPQRNSRTSNSTSMSIDTSTLYSSTRQESYDTSLSHLSNNDSTSQFSSNQPPNQGTKRPSSGSFNTPPIPVAAFKQMQFQQQQQSIPQKGLQPNPSSQRVLVAPTAISVKDKSNNEQPVKFNKVFDSNGNSIPQHGNLTPTPELDPNSSYPGEFIDVSGTICDADAETGPDNAVDVVDQNFDLYAFISGTSDYGS